MGIIRRKRLAGLATAALVVSALLTSGCASQSCALYVDYTSPQQMHDDAVLVVLGTVGESASTRHVGGTSLDVYPFTLHQVVKGDPATQLSGVATAIDTCAPSSPAGLLPPGENIILFASPSPTEDVWLTLTPYDGVIESPTSTHHSPSTRNDPQRAGPACSALLEHSDDRPTIAAAAPLASSQRP